LLRTVIPSTSANACICRWRGNTPGLSPGQCNAFADDINFLAMRDLGRVLASACPRRKTVNPQVGRILRLEYEFPSRLLRPVSRAETCGDAHLGRGIAGKKGVEDAESPRPADNVSYDPQSSTGIGTRVGQAGRALPVTGGYPGLGSAVSGFSAPLPE
jgi:hypothetical protein